MNKICRTVWNAARQNYVVAHEKVAAKGRPSSLRTTIAVVAAATLTLISSSVFAADCPSVGGVSTVVSAGSCDVVVVGDSVNFQGVSGIADVSIASIAGATADSTAATGTGLYLNGTLTVTGDIGTATNKIDTVRAGVNGSTVTFSSNVAATNLTLTGNGTVNMNGNFTGTTQLGGGGGVLNVAAGKNVGAVTSTGNVGTVNFAGSTTIGGNLGVGGVSALTAINFNGGTVTNAGYELVSTVNLNNAAILRYTANDGSNRTGTLNVNDAATLDLQRFHISPSTAFNTAAGTTIKTSIASATPGANSHGYVAVGGGAATVAAGTSLSVAVDPGVTIVAGTQYKIIDTSVASIYGTLTVTSPSSRYRFKVITDPNDLIIQASLADYAIAAGFSATNLATPAASRLTDLSDTATGATAALLTYLDGLSEENLAVEARKLAPSTSFPVLRTMAAATSGALGTVSDRLAELRGGTTLADAGVMSGIVTGGVSPDKEFWVKGFGGVDKQNKDNDFDGYTSSGLGMAFGYDRAISADVRVGGAFSYADSKVRIQDVRSGDWTKANSYQLTIYGSKEYGAAFAEGSAAYGLHKFETLRATPNTTQSTGNFDASQWTLRLGGGFRVKYGTYNLIPMAGFTYSDSTRDAYTESGGGGAALTYNKFTSKLSRSDIGARLVGTDETANVRPEIHVAWLHDFNRQKVDTVAAYAGGGATFTTPGQSLGKNGLSIGGGVIFTPNRLTRVTLSYNYEGRSGYSSHTGQIVGSWKF